MARPNAGCATSAAAPPQTLNRRDGRVNKWPADRSKQYLLHLWRRPVRNCDTTPDATIARGPYLADRRLCSSAPQPVVGPLFIPLRRRLEIAGLQQMLLH